MKKIEKELVILFNKLNGSFPRKLSCCSASDRGGWITQHSIYTAQKMQFSINYRNP